MFDDGTIAFGCVISDEENIVLSASKEEVINPKVALAEMLAIIWSLNLARDNNIEKIVSVGQLSCS